MSKPTAVPVSQKDEARLCADRILEKPYIDPDGDICLLARELLRADERIAQLEAAIQKKDEALKVAEEALRTCYESHLEGDHIQKQAIIKIRAALAEEKHS